MVSGVVMNQYFPVGELASSVQHEASTLPSSAQISINLSDWYCPCKTLLISTVFLGTIRCDEIISKKYEKFLKAM